MIETKYYQDISLAEKPKYNILAAYEHYFKVLGNYPHTILNKKI